MDILILAVAFAAFAGTLVASVLGYLGSGEAWNLKKFLASVMRGLVAAVALALAYNFTEINTVSYMIAFLGGAGVDVLGNRIASTIDAKTDTTTTV